MSGVIEKAESIIEGIVWRAQFSIISRMYPELARLTDEKDKRWAVWIGQENTPRWQRLFMPIAIFVIGPLLSTSLLFFIAGEVRWLSLKRVWPMLLVIGIVGGIVVAGLLMEFVRGKTLARRYFAAMRIFEHDVCAECGYDMTGHPCNSNDLRQCPECGCHVPPLKSTRDCNPPQLS